MVVLSRFFTDETERDLIASAEKRLADASACMQDAERAWAELESHPIDQTAIRSMRMRMDLAQSQREAPLADWPSLNGSCIA